MFEVFFINDRTATVKTRGRSMLIEQAHILLKKVRGQWRRVLTGVYRAITANRERAWPVEIVLGAVSLGERLLLTAQRFFKSICPERGGKNHRSCFGSNGARGWTWPWPGK